MGATRHALGGGLVPAKVVLITSGAAVRDAVVYVGQCIMCRAAVHSLIHLACGGLRCRARLMFGRQVSALSDENATTSLPHLFNWLEGYLYICHHFTLSPLLGLLIDPYHSKLAKTDSKSFLITSYARRLQRLPRPGRCFLWS